MTTTEKTRQPTGLRRPQAIAQLAEAALALDDERVLLARATELVAEALDVERAEIFEKLPGGCTVLLRAAAGWEADLVGATTTLIEQQSPLHALLAANRAAVVESEIGPSAWADIPLLRGLGFTDTRLVVIPSPEQACAYGLLGMHTARREFEADDESFMRTVAQLLAAQLLSRRVRRENKLLQQITLAIGFAEDLQQALHGALSKVLEVTEWEYGESWLPSADGRCLERGPVHFQASERLSRFASQSEGVTFLPGCGLPGRVWQQRTPEWIIDVATEDNGRYVRSRLARGAGLHSALAIPVLAGGEVLAVLCFYLSHRARKDERVVRLISEAFASAGPLVKRKHLEEAHARLASIVASADDAIVGLGLDGRVVSWNRGAERMLGRVAAFAVGELFATLLDGLAGPDIDRLLERVTSTGVVQHAQLVRRAPGDRLALSLSVSSVMDGRGRLIGLSVICKDITEIREAAEDRERLAAIVNHSEMAIIGKTLDGIITSWNAGAERMYGYSSEEAVGQPITLIVPRHCREEVGRILERVQRGAGVAPYETVRQRRDGNRIHVWLTVSPIKDSDGRIVGASAMSRDITAEKSAHEALQRAHGELEHRVQERTAELTQANQRLRQEIVQREQYAEQSRKHLRELARVARVSTLGEMASGLAHELNQPLCAIVNYTEACLNMLRAGDAPRSELCDAIGHVAGQAARAGEVVRRLRDFIRRRALLERRADPNRIVSDVVDLFKPEVIQNKAEVVLHLADGLPDVRVDIIQIQQVVLNLARNALESMASEPRRHRRLEISTSQDGPEFVQISVRDHGTGIPASINRRLFEPFLTTKDDGMGMGLSISRSIVDAHGGRIWVAHNEDRGVTFHFTLPVAGQEDHD